MENENKSDEKNATEVVLFFLNQVEMRFLFDKSQRIVCKFFIFNFSFLILHLIGARPPRGGSGFPLQVLARCAHSGLSAAIPRAARRRRRRSKARASPFAPPKRSAKETRRRTIHIYIYIM
jgi:hypothetical protein